MFTTWGKIISRLRWPVIGITIAFLAFAGIWGTTVFSRLTGSSSLDDPSSESARITNQINDRFGQQTVDVVGIYSSKTLTVDAASYRTAVQNAATKIRAIRGVESVSTYYETNSPSMVSTDKHDTFVAVIETAKTYDGLSTSISNTIKAGATGDLTAQVGGQKIVDNNISDQVPADIGKAEAIAMPLLLIALLIVFGSVVSALMPLMVGIVSVMGAFLIVRVITIFGDVSIFALNIITILGLGLAIDYGLFIVSRFREELDKQHARGEPDDYTAAVCRSLATAGRTIMISGLLVTLALCGLTIFPQVFLRSMGFGGAAAVLVAMITSLTLLPAVLVLLGRRIDSGRMPWGRKRYEPSVAGAANELDGRWARATTAVLKRPIICLVGVLAVLAVLVLPFAKVHFGGVDARMLPAGTESRTVAERVADDFPGGNSYPIRVLIKDSTPAAAASYMKDVTAIRHVQTATISQQKAGDTLLNVTYDGDPSSLEARGVAGAIRGLTPPSGSSVMVGGMPAAVIDQLHSLGARLPWMALIVAGITFVLLAVGFGSVVVPIKAILMNLISVGAAFGVVTWIFQDGHLSGFFGFTPTGYVEASQPVLMVAILFGLSMDYEVFLLSRIRERWDEGADATESIVSGVQRTGKMITTAAVLLCIVIGFFATSGITFIKMIGVGMVVAILVDATLVRLVLVPITMRLLGRYNWWAPAFLTRLYVRYGIHESDSENGPPRVELDREGYALVAP